MTLAERPNVLIADPDIGPMTAVVLPPTVCSVDGVPVVCDTERELCILPPTATPMEIRHAIYDHTNNTGRPPRAVIFDWRRR